MGVCLALATALETGGREGAVVSSADNVLDHQLGEPDNITVLPGRTIQGRLRATF